MHILIRLVTIGHFIKLKKQIHNEIIKSIIELDS